MAIEFFSPTSPDAMNGLILTISLQNTELNQVCNSHRSIQIEKVTAFRQRVTA